MYGAKLLPTTLIIVIHLHASKSLGLRKAQKICNFIKQLRQHTVTIHFYSNSIVLLTVKTHMLLLLNKVMLPCSSYLASGVHTHVGMGPELFGYFCFVPLCNKHPTCLHLLPKKCSHVIHVKQSSLSITMLVTGTASATQEGEEEGGGRWASRPVQANPEQRLSHNWRLGRCNGPGGCFTRPCIQFNGHQIWAGQRLWVSDCLGCDPSLAQPSDVGHKCHLWLDCCWWNAAHGWRLLAQHHCTGDCPIAQLCYPYDV